MTSARQRLQLFPSKFQRILIKIYHRVAIASKQYPSKNNLRLPYRPMIVLVFNLLDWATLCSLAPSDGCPTDNTCLAQGHDLKMYLQFIAIRN